MTGSDNDRILRAAAPIATTIRLAFWLVAMLAALTGTLRPGTGLAQEPQLPASTNEISTAKTSELESFVWDFGRSTDPEFNDEPQGWKRVTGTGYPSYIEGKIVPRDLAFSQSIRKLDLAAIAAWTRLRPSLNSVLDRQGIELPPFPPSISDMVVDRYFRVQLDGGQFSIESPMIPASRLYQYRFSCDITTRGLRRDTARAEFVFLTDDGVKVQRGKEIPQYKELATYSTARITGNTEWRRLSLDLIRPPQTATKMLVRLHVEQSEDGQQDISGTIGFDNVRIDQYPQLQLATNEPLGVYKTGSPIVATAKIMGLSRDASRVRFDLVDQAEELVASSELEVLHQTKRKDRNKSESDLADEFDSEVSWPLPRLQPGFYRINARLVGTNSETLSTETTVAVIDTLVEGPAHGCFGWTLPQGNSGIGAKELARWAGSLGVAWIKYPSWLDPADTAKAEQTLAVFSKMQDAGIQTIGMLDVPPENQIAKYGLRSRRELVAALLFRDLPTWQPMLEPVMEMLTLKVRTWQLGSDRDHSFLGRPRLRESITQISSGLQGFGQPLEVAISWPWMEAELPDSQASWQAVCRTSDPPLGAKELDQYLTLSQKDARSDGPRTWLLLDPIDKNRYDLETRIRDLVLRMATVKSHRVQAAFVSDPRDPENGLLRSNGRPGELLLPWRTTSRMIGNLRKVGKLQLRSGASNGVFVGNDRAVVMLWSSVPTEEKIYLGDNVQAVDVWGRVTNLPIEPDPIQPGQRIRIGRLPIFIVGADPKLLAFRMSVDIENNQLDSLLGEDQNLTVQFTNPTRDSLVGSMRLRSPQAWRVSLAKRNWEALPGRTASEDFKVVLSNIAKVGEYELPIQFEVETVPPKLVTVYRKVQVGPDGLELKATTRLLPGGEIRVQIEFTNFSDIPQSYECMVFPPAGRQYKRRFMTIPPGETLRRDYYWPDGAELIGKKMLLRAIEQDGQRVLNYSIDVVR